jgi:CRISPR-associated protein Csb2
MTYLVLDVQWHFLHYHGKEWPPHPSRVFQAVCPHADCREGSEEASILRWLERQPAPEIVAPLVEVGEEVITYVPNNDDHDGKLPWSETSLHRVDKLLCNYNFHGEQDNWVQYRWAVPPSERDLACKAAELLSRITAVGWGVDVVRAWARVLNQLELPEVPKTFEHLVQDPQGGLLIQVPHAGYLSELEQRYQRGLVQQPRSTNGQAYDTDTSPAPGFRMVRYRQASAPTTQVAWAAFKLTLLGGTKLVSVPWRRATDVAAWVRHAAADCTRPHVDQAWLRRYVQGHVDSGEDPTERLWYVPLLSLGPHADGAVRRFLLLSPARFGGSVQQVARWVNGAVLTDIQGAVRAQTRRLESVDRALVPYCGSTASWTSVTPVLLGFSTKNGKVCEKKTDKLMLRALVDAGIAPDNVESVAYRKTPRLACCGRVDETFVPDHLKKWQRYHVDVKLRRPMVGPLVVGIGRHYGLGLLAAV